jgi:hypothetical protein
MIDSCIKTKLCKFYVDYALILKKAEEDETDHKGVEDGACISFFIFVTDQNLL